MAAAVVVGSTYAPPADDQLPLLLLMSMLLPRALPPPPVRRRAPRACRRSLASPVLLAQGLALSTHHTTWPLPALAHGCIHTRPRRSNIRESGRQHARRLLSGWP